MNLGGLPLTASTGGNAAFVQRSGDAGRRGDALGSKLGNRREHVLSGGLSLLLKRPQSDLTAGTWDKVMFRLAIPLPVTLDLRGQSGLRALADEPCFEFGNSDNLLKHETANRPMGRRKIAEHHLDLRVEKLVQERLRPRQSIDLSNDQGRLVCPTLLQRLVELRAIVAAATLDLDVRRQQQLVVVAQVTPYGRFLGFETRPLRPCLSVDTR